MRLKTQKERGNWKGGNAIKTATDDIINYIEVYLKKTVFHEIRTVNTPDVVMAALPLP